MHHSLDEFFCTGLKKVTLAFANKHRFNYLKIIQL